jgi:hypothetical protein
MNEWPNERAHRSKWSKVHKDYRSTSWKGCRHLRKILLGPDFHLSVAPSQHCVTQVTCVQLSSAEGHKQSRADPTAVKALEAEQSPKQHWQREAAGEEPPHLLSSCATLFRSSQCGSDSPWLDPDPHFSSWENVLISFSAGIMVFHCWVE